jgi:hypothetical protein
VVRDGQIQASQQKDLIEQLQARVEITKNRMVNIKMFKSQVIEIRSRVSAAQRNLLAKVEAICDNYLLVNQVSENLSSREREAGAARVAFQEAVNGSTASPKASSKTKL